LRQTSIEVAEKVQPRSFLFFFSFDNVNASNNGSAGVTEEEEKEEVKERYDSLDNNEESTTMMDFSNEKREGEREEPSIFTLLKRSPPPLAPSLIFKPCKH